MHPRLYRLIETLQRIDRALRLEQTQARPDTIALIRLHGLKLRAKTLIGRLMRSPVPA